MRTLLALALMLTLLLSGCRLPSLVPLSPASHEGADALRAVPVATLSGRLGSPRQVLADYQEFAKGATVSLIDGTTGYTAATTVTDAQGNFVLQFQQGFAPVAERLYYLEAVKGIKERGPNTTPNETYNQAGADIVRLRTFLFHEPASGGWVSPYNTLPGPIYISRQTTALALALQLKQDITLAARDFVGCLETDVYQEVYGLSAAEFTAVNQIVEKSIEEDRDPIHFLAYDTNNGTFVNVYKGHFVSGLSPEEGSVGDEIQILGDGFDRPGPMVVQFHSQITASVIGTPTKSAIRVRVPVGARNGAVSVTINGLRQLGPEFKVNSFDGHRSMLDGVLYVANYDRQRVVRVHPDGTVEDFVQVSDGPTQVVVRDGMLYVACQLADKVVKVNVATKQVSDFVSVPRPSGMAFLGNVLHVASATAGEIRRFNPDASPAGAAYTGFTEPTALAFGRDYASGSPLLYVAEKSNPDRVTQLNLATQVKTPWAYRTNPMGLAVDSAGAVYVAAYDDGMVYRVLPSGALTVFARVPAPCGLMLDPNGVMYVASDSQHQIYRVSPLGDLKPYAYGINNPRGLAVDDLGNLYVSLSQSNGILKVEDRGADGYRTRPFLSGIAAPHSITWRNGRLYIAHRDAGGVTSADANGSLRTEVSGLIYPGGADVGADGTIYTGNVGASVYSEAILGVPSSTNYVKAGIQITAPNGVVSTRMPILKWKDHGIVGLDDGTRFVIHSYERNALIMYASTDGPDSSYRYRILHEFATAPRMLERNATGNCLFVSVTGDDRIYRFKTPGTPGPNSVWTMDTVAGLTSPSAMSYDKDNDRLYVLDGSSIRRLNGAAGAAPTLDAAWGPVTATSATDLAYAHNASHPNTLFVAVATLNEVRAFSVNAPPAAVTNPTHTYISGLGIQPQNVLAHLTNGEIYVRASNKTGAYRISTGKVVSTLHSYADDAILDALGITPDGSTVRVDNHWGRVHGKAFLHGLIQSHEVALHGNWLYVGSYFGTSYTGVHAFNLVDGSDMLLRGFDITTESGYPTHSGVGTLAVNPATNRLYAGSGKGRIWEVVIDGSANHGKVSEWATLEANEWLYGLDITAARDKLWAVGASRSLYTARLSDKQVVKVWAGLSSPRF
ncbi:Serine/threonine-protein kinase PknD [compost metagenome]